MQIGSRKHYPATSSPEAASVHSVALQPGDVVVLGTDGLFDNIHDAELCEVVAGHLQRAVVAAGELDEAAGAVAAGIAAAARQRSQDPAYASPFALRRHPRLPRHVRAVVRPRGGKPDDITAVVGIAH